MNRWLILAGYALLTASTQMVWLSFAPITSASAADMHVSVEQIGWLSAIFAGLYVLLGLPAGRWLDSHFSRALGFGALLNAAGVLLRLAAPTNFTVQLIGQLLLAAGQPFVVSAVNGIAARYFEPAERPTAIAVGTASMFLGVLLASLSAPGLYAAGKLPLVLLVHAIPTIIGAIWLMLALRTPPTQSAHAEEQGSGIAWVLKDGLMWKLAALLVVGYGVFGALSTWLEALLKHHGVSALTSGELLGGLVIGGIVGSVTLPVYAAAKNRRHAVLVGAMLISLAMLAGLAFNLGVLWFAAWLVLGGFSLLACLPIVLEWAERHAGSSHQGVAVAFLIMAGNVGSLVAILALGGVIASGVTAPLAMLAVLVAAGLGVVAVLPRESTGRSDAALK